MKTKHTPGPWTVEGSCVRSKNDRDWVCETSIRNLAGKFVGWTKKDEEVIAPANARLIAAAPELLDALKRLLPFAVIRVLDQWDSGRNPDYNASKELADSARLAIAKAEGK